MSLSKFGSINWKEEKRKERKWLAAYYYPWVGIRIDFAVYTLVCFTSPSPSFTFISFFSPFVFSVPQHCWSGWGYSLIECSDVWGHVVLVALLFSRYYTIFFLIFFLFSSSSTLFLTLFFSSEKSIKTRTSAFWGCFEYQ